MRLKDIAHAKRPLFSFEFFPPKTDAAERNLEETARQLALLGPAFFSMMYGAGGSTRGKTVALARHLQQLTGVDTMCHLTCVDQSREEVRAVLREIEALGMNNILALRGDPPAGKTDWTPHPEGFHYASELVAEIRGHRKEGVSIGVAGFPEMHPNSKTREDDLRFLKFKVDAGADAVITQLFYDNAAFFQFDRDAKALGISVPIIPGVMPIVGVEQVRRFCKMCGARIPEALDAELGQYLDDSDAARDFGVELAVRQIRELLDYGVPAVHIYCMNKAYSADKIVRQLGLAPAPAEKSP